MIFNILVFAIISFYHVLIESDETIKQEIDNYIINDSSEVRNYIYIVPENYQIIHRIMFNKLKENEKLSFNESLITDEEDKNIII